MSFAMIYAALDNNTVNHGSASEDGTFLEAWGEKGIML